MAPETRARASKRRNMDPETASSATVLLVEVAYATPKRQLILEVRVPAGATAAQAIEASEIRKHFPEIAPEPVVGIFSQKIALDHPLSAGDRVEIYRPLIADPKETRRHKAEMERAERKKKN